ncbi:MAG: hypothetical protein HKN76_08300, partial [Saprospiraceae bacterium]|nr:hypothetical protein [Saprospiraceae bacterium]
MKSIFIWFALLWGTLSLLAQQVAPGGVEGSLYWLHSSKLPDRQSIFQSSSKSQIIEIFPAGRDLNYHSSSVVSTLNLSNHLSTLRQTTIIAVVHPATEQEEAIWEFHSDGQKMMLMTSHRIADLGQYEFINLINRPKNKPYISHYFHHLEDQTLKFDCTLAPEPGVIPIEKMHSGMSEFIVFDRVISQAEKAAIECYLSIKYGIPLSQHNATDYIDANHQVIWDATKNRRFNREVVAIGRDDQSSLHQKQTMSEALIISSGPMAKSNVENKSEIPDGSYLFWSHDGGEKVWNQKNEESIKELSRTWIAVVKGSMQTVPTNVYLREENLVVVPGPGKIWWLDIYPHPDNPSLSSKTSVPFQWTDSEDQDLVVEDIRWDLDGSGSDLFKLSVGPPFKVDMEITESSCLEDQADLTVGIFGGYPPYQMQISHLESKKIMALDTDSAYQKFDRLAAGHYLINISDKNNQTFSGQFKVNHSDGIEIEMPDLFVIDKNEELVLDPNNFVSVSKDPQITWILPDGEKVLNQALQAKKAGPYKLVVEKEGCINSKSFTLEVQPIANLQEVLLYPNPITSGVHFNVFVRLQQVAPVGIEILDVKGGSISDHYLTGKQEYRL